MEKRPIYTEKRATDTGVPEGIIIGAARAVFVFAQVALLVHAWGLALPVARCCRPPLHPFCQLRNHARAPSEPRRGG